MVERDQLAVVVDAWLGDKQKIIRALKQRNKKQRSEIYRLVRKDGRKK